MPRTPSLEPARRENLIVHGAAAAMLIALAALLFFSMPYESPTVDEPLHFTRGAAFWWAGDTRLSFAHPPLANALATITSRNHPIVDLTEDHPSWDRSRVKALSQTVMDADYPAFRKELFRARDVMMVLAVLFGIYLYRFCKERFDTATALIALFLYAIHPTLLAHARLVTTDMPVTIASFVTLGELVRYREKRELRYLLSTGLALGAALSTKFNAVFLVPVVATAAFLDALRPPGRRRKAGKTRRNRYLTFFLHATVVTALAVLAVNASYRFQHTGETVAAILAEPEPQNSITEPFGDHLLLERRSALPSLPKWLPLPLPYTYVFGLFTMNFSSQHERSTYFMGEHIYGSRLYFPVLLVLKQPLVLLFLLGLAARRLRNVDELSPTTRLFGGAAALYLGFAVASHLNLGVRYVLPIMPLLIVLAAREAASVVREREAHPYRFRAGIVLAVLSTVGTLAAFPHYIGYFNALAGGEARAHRISIVGEDWGQDVADAAHYIEREHLAPVAYAAYGAAGAYEMRFDGVTAGSVQCEKAPSEATWIVLHATQLRRAHCYAWLGLPEREPDIRINEHIYLYRYQPLKD